MDKTKEPKNITVTDNVTPLPEPIQPRPWYKEAGRRLIAFVFVLAMLFLFGGIYQFGLFQQTSSDVPAGEYQPKIQEPIRSVPTTIFVLESEDDAATSSIQSLADKANAILSQARVTLAPTAIRTVNVGEVPSGPRIAGSSEELKNLLPSLQPDRLHIVVTRGLGGINGVAFPGKDVVAVAEYTTSFDFRVLAHEVGHILALGHVSDKVNLMNSGSSGTEITTEQARRMYRASRDFASNR